MALSGRNPDGSTAFGGECGRSDGANGSLEDAPALEVNGRQIHTAKQETKLELTWIGKENRPRLEPRVLIEDPEKSYHAPDRLERLGWVMSH